MVRYLVPIFEQAPKGKGTVLGLVWFGGYTFSPAAVTSWHRDGLYKPASAIVTSAWVEAPLARVTVCGVVPPRSAALRVPCRRGGLRQRRRDHDAGYTYLFRGRLTGQKFRRRPL